MGTTDSRVVFKDTINALLENNISEQEEGYWIEIFKEPNTVEDIFFVISPNIIKELLNKQPANLEKMLKIAVKIIDEFSKAKIDCERIVLLNSIRIITRLMPILLENEDVRKIIWENGCGFSLADGLMGLLFKPGFGTVNSSSISPYEFDPNRAWKSGVYVDDMPHANLEIVENRIEVLRAILACCSQSLYCEAAQAGNYVNPYGWLFTSDEIRYSKDAFYSLMNTVLGFPIEKINRMISGPFGNAEIEASLACQILVGLLDSKIPNIHHISENSDLKLVHDILQNLHSEQQGFSAELSPLKLDNVFLDGLKTLNDPKTFKYIAKCFNSQFDTVIAYNSAYLFSTVDEVPYYQELLIMFWLFIEHNSKFEDYLMKKNIFKILDMILFLI